jgi:hypothetical protein
VTAASVNDTTLQVTADLPYQTGITSYGVPLTLGSTPVVLPGEVSLAGPGRLLWRASGETVDALGQVLARGVPRAGIARFETAFEALDNGQDARWQPGPGHVVQQLGSGNVVGQPVALPMMAVAREPLRSVPLFVNLTVSQPVGRTVGLVYNFRSWRDCSVFYLTHEWRPVGFSGAISTVTAGFTEFRNGIPQGSIEQAVASTGSDPVTYTLDLRAESRRLIMGCSVRFRSGETVTRPDIDLSRAPLQTDTRLGIADRRGPAGRFTQQPVFERLTALHGEGGAQVLIPLGSTPRLLARIVLKRGLLALPDGDAFPPPIPEADYEAAFWLSGAPGTYGYGYGYGASWQGIGAGLLLRA